MHKKPSIVAIGKFGTVHCGHAKILNILHDSELKPIVFSFMPSPALFFSKNKTLHGSILSLRQKIEYFKSLNILLILEKFNKQFASIEPENFIKILKERFNMKELVVGEDFAFGKERKGNTELLKNLQQKYDFKLNIVLLKKEHNRVISTTSLRKMILNGKIEEFNKFSQIPYALTGKVTKGLQLASLKLGFATANVKILNVLLPKFGVYACEIKIENDDKTYKGITNIGIKPTINNNIPVLEVHIFNFNQNIYGKRIWIFLKTFIRDEIKFASLEELKLQIVRDIKCVASPHLVDL